MCNNFDHDSSMTSNPCCLNNDCNWHGPYMLKGKGPASEIKEFGNSHCPICGYGKYVDDRLTNDPFFVAIQAYVNQEGGD